MSTEKKIPDKYGFLSKTFQKQPNLLQENARTEKWVKMIGDWERYSTHKAQKLKSRIRKGVPNCFRGRVWYLLTDAEAIKENYPGDYYTHLLSLEVQRNVEIEITLDLDRTYPTHIKFQSIEGKQSLFRVLKAYAVMDPEVSYTQGMSFIVAMFLIFLSEEETFWLLVTLLTQYGFRGFYIQGMPKVYSCFYVANGALRHHMPKVFKKFKENGLSVSMYATQWFMTGFTSSFSIETTLRIWDTFFSEGIKIFYRVFLAIISLRVKEFAICSFERSMEIFRSLSSELETEDILKKAFKFSLSRSLLTRLEQDYEKKPKAKYIDWVVVKR